MPPRIDEAKVGQRHEVEQEQVPGEQPDGEAAVDVVLLARHLLAAAAFVVLAHSRHGGETRLI